MKKYRLFTRNLLTFTCAMLLCSCASHAVRDQPPFVQINGLRLGDESLSLDLGVRNINAEEILIEHIEFSVMLDETSLAVYSAPSRASVVANGTENLRFELSGNPDGIALLHDLEEGKITNLEYTFEGMLRVFEGGQVPVEREGHIYPVPGRAGHFR